MRIVVRFETRELTVSWSSIPGDDGAPVQQVAKRLNLNAAVVEPENFDRWLFEDAGFETTPQQHLDDVLRAKIGTAVQEYGPTAEQRLKLRLAGKGDVKRFFDQVEERRGRFDKERRNYQSGLAALKGLNDLSLIYTEGPFGDGSLFAKTLRRIRDDQKQEISVFAPSSPPGR
jgi:hypothetical protein